MAITKIQSESLNLADDFAFTGTITGAGGGKVLQVVQTVKTDTFSSSSTSWIDVTGLSVSITPASTSNKVLIMITANFSANEHIQAKLVRNSTDLFIGDAAGSRTRASYNTFGRIGSGSDLGGTGYLGAVPMSVSYLDSPATTSSTTYKIQTIVAAGSYISYVNKTALDTDAASLGRLASSITAYEIAG